MLILIIFVWTLGGFGVLGTVASRIRYDDWWIRAFDFPRVQLTALMGIALAGLPWFFDPGNGWHWFLLSALVVSIAFQLAKIWPYTPLAAADVEVAAKASGDHVISILESNVLMPNEKREPLLGLIRKLDPDIVLLMETNDEWERDMAAIESDYPYRVPVPLDNLYGMHLYSRLELIEPEVRYLVKDDIPSIRTRVRLRNDRVIWLYAVHPMPPSPTEAYASTSRDGELMIVGKEIKEKDEPTIVTGDLNDVAWSHSTELFRRISQMLDPRRGRGFYSTFHADYWLARWPLDHFFHSKHFTLAHLERQPHIGSDHFPVHIKLAFEPAKGTVQETPNPSEEEKDTAEEKVRSALYNDPNTVRSQLDLG